MIHGFTDVPRGLIEQGVANAEGYMSDAAYQLVTDLVPLVCVDVIPVRESFDAITELGAITRATGSEAGKLALIGGRIRKDETVEEALSRHLDETLGLTDFLFYRGQSAAQPFYIGQYKHLPTDPGLYDPSKQSVALTYLVEIDDIAINVSNEALAYHWLREDNIPENTAYHQGQVLARAFTHIRGS